MAGRRAAQAFLRFVTGENLDLYALAVAAIAFTVLGFLNIVKNTTDLSSVILALLALLAISQVRSRNHFSDISRSQSTDKFALFESSYPDSLAHERVTASGFLFIGESMVRAVQIMRTDIARILADGGSIHVALLDPIDGELLRVTNKSQTSMLRERIVRTIDELQSLRQGASGSLEIRVLSSVPKVCILGLDFGKSSGIMYVQHYEYKPTKEGAPIFRLQVADGFWYQHFTNEATRMWEDATPWPLTPTQKVARIARPVFKDAFGAELEDVLTHSNGLLITGVTRNSFVRDNYRRLGGLLSSGCRIRFLLVDPLSEAMTTVSNRYTAERTRDPDTARARTRDTLRLLEELRSSTGGSISIRLTSHPLAIGLIAVDSEADERDDASALFAEYYTYQTLGEPKFALHPSDVPWFDHFVGEAECLWEAAAPHAPDDAAKTRISELKEDTP